VTLPYSPEYAPRFGQLTGGEILGALAGLTGGEERTDVLEILSDPPRAARTVPLLPWLLAVAVSLLLLEIAGRRLSLWQPPVPPAAEPPRGRRGKPRRERAAPAPEPAAPEPSPARASVFDVAKERARRRRR
jgi:hypothetical protein